MKILFFGQLTDITQQSECMIDNVEDTNQLIEKIHSLYPAIKNCKYRIAVDKKMITGNTELNIHSTIALLPPFSGG
jgi:molybdopterin synthase sulfur carrier subunit